MADRTRTILLATLIPILTLLLIGLGVWFAVSRRKQRTLPAHEEAPMTPVVDVPQSNTEYMRDKLGRDIQVTETVLAPIELVDSNEEIKENTTRGAVVEVADA